MKKIFLFTFIICFFSTLMVIGQIESDSSTIVGTWQLQQIGVSHNEEFDFSSFDINNYNQDPIFVGDSIFSINENGTYKIDPTNKKGNYSLINAPIQTGIWKKKMIKLRIGQTEYLVVQLKPEELLLSREFNSNISYGYSFVKK